MKLCLFLVIALVMVSCGTGKKKAEVPPPPQAGETTGDSSITENPLSFDAMGSDSGHIDGLAPLVSFEKDSDGSLLWVEIPKSLARFVIAKGSICLDGVSLTVNELVDNKKGSRAKAMVIPETLEKTTFGSLPADWRFNLEVDLVGKYLERLKFRG